MTEEVLDTATTRSWAEVLLKQYAATIKAMHYSEEMGVKLKEVRGHWQIILVRRSE
jgi:hypothetical protein